MCQHNEIGPVESERICFCSRVEIRSETVNLYDRSAMAYNMVLLALVGFALCGSYFLRFVPFAGLAWIGGVLIGISPFYYLYAFITWARPYERLAKKSGLPAAEPDEATLFVIGDRSSWEFPDEASATPFEVRHFPALLAYLLSPNISVEHIGFVLPTILIVNGLNSVSFFQLATGLLLIGFVLFRFPWQIWYEVAPGQLRFMRESNLGRQEQIEIQYQLEGRKVIADFAKKRLILLGTDKTDIINLRNLRNAREFCYYVMLARAAGQYAPAQTENGETPGKDIDTIGSRVKFWGRKD